ncbi:MAG: hypothetical protein QOG62_105 [Thermoleophilaceae bacterium]|nr:hypothetical protein [Thermoleophilaceae bacterium]
MLGAIGLALILWVGGSGCARAHVEARAAAAISPIVGHQVKVNCPGLIASALIYESHQGWVEFPPDGELPTETKVTAEVCAGLQRLVDNGASLDLVCLDNNTCNPENQRVALGTAVLSHEAGHLSGLVDESQTECFGESNLMAVAEALGSTQSTARQIYEWQTIFGADMLPDSYRQPC